MRIISQSVTSLTCHNLNFTSINRPTCNRKTLFGSKTSILFLLNSLTFRLSSGYFVTNRLRYSTTRISRRTFRTTRLSEVAMVDDVNVDIPDDKDSILKTAKTRKRSSTTTATSNDDTTKDIAEVSTSTNTRQKSSKKNVAISESSNDRKVDDAALKEKAGGPVTVAKKAKLPAHQVITERDDLPKLWNTEKAASNGSYTFKVASWNVAGLRAVLNKSPNVFAEFVTRHNIDILCLQETKLQEQHLDDPKLNIKQTLGMLNEYDDYWSCSTAKKGYSGTAVFIRRRKSTNASTTTTTGGSTKSKDSSSKKQTSMLQFVKAKSTPNDDVPIVNELENGKELEALPIDVNDLIPTNIAYALGKEKHDTEGRLIVVDYPLFTLCNVYVPNAGQNLDRLSYRVNEWDKDFLTFIHQKRNERKGLPVVWLGDLNVAHTNLEVWNDGAKHLAKQAGVTAEERASFQEQLDAGHIDAFRHLHTTAAGHYSYWSMRAGNRGVNKGLRLDYFICDRNLFDENSPAIVRDCYMDAAQEGSDHCPVILEIEIKGTPP